MVDVTMNVAYTPVKVVNHPKFVNGPSKDLGLKDIEKATRCCSILKTIGLVLVVITAVSSLIGMIIIWKSGLIDNMISQKLVIERDTHVYDVWVKPPVKPVVNVYLFNYTNIPQFAAGKEKLKIQEVGPYAYRLSFEKVRVLFKTNNTISFQEKKNYQFDPDLSNGTLSDVITVPNIALLSAVARVVGKNVFYQMPLVTLVGGLNVEAFQQLKVQELLWGYEDPLYDMARPILNLVDDVPDKLGLLVGKNGTGEERFTIFTGMSDINQLGVIAEFRDKKKLNIWKSDECNRIDGSEGSMFPPPQVAAGKRLFVFLPQLCRRMPFDAKKHMITNGMPAVRYAPPADVFSADNPDNACYCVKGKCPPSGVFDVGPCAFDGPLLASFPHFFQGDPALLEQYEGLNPIAEKHQFYIDIHDRFGVPLGGKSRLQISIIAKNAKYFPSMKMFKKDMILPMSWFEVSVDDLPPEVKSDLKLATHTATHGLMYFLLFVFVLSSGMVAYQATKMTRVKEPLSPGYNVNLPKQLILVQKI
ncbi:scavenger receptor class B member 1-like [Neocloeon triangulifer]|uniref:scavenger receptor class B member 1-like n=1 Tax=Neocloeon triangulifer TaxID=2078957 RepID=UPI00286F3F03|nr:scavenger receptor class B member 1-like [Neocloeon triangulifer]